MYKNRPVDGVTKEQTRTCKPIMHDTHSQEHTGTFTGSMPTQNPHPILTTITKKFNILHRAANVASILNTFSKPELANFYHKSLGSPPNLTILCVLSHHPEEMLTFLGMNRKLVKRHLPPSTVTAKGYKTRTTKELTASLLWAHIWRQKSDALFNAH